jgi:hypothetical protein
MEQGGGAGLALAFDGFVWVRGRCVPAHAVFFKG